MKHSPALPTGPDFPGDRRITLEQLRVFAAIARTRSFQTAGRELGRTQSAITQSIKNLEEYLCCRLLERRQGSVLGLTPAGERMLPDAVDVLRKMDVLVRSVRDFELEGSIRFGIPLNIGTSELRNALADCAAANKKLRVRLISDTSMHLAAMLEDGVLDAAIMNEGTTEAADGKSVVLSAFQEEPLVWVFNPDAPSDWTGEVPFIAFSEGSPWTQAAVKALNEAGIAHYYAYVSPSFESICKAVDEGVGVTVLPLSEVPARYASLAGNAGQSPLHPAPGLPSLPALPPLPKVRTVIRAGTDNAAVYGFCKLVEQLPIFAAAREERA